MKNKKILLLPGIISSSFGTIGAILSFFQERYVIAVVSTFLIIGGFILIAFAFDY